MESYLRSYKIHKGCCTCGYNKGYAALCFHHKDPSTKSYELSKTRKSWRSTRHEIAKCDVMCLNCHAELHEAEETTVSVEVDPDQMVLFK